MKVVFAASIPYVPFSAGAAKANRCLAEGLAARGHEVHVVAIARTTVGPRATLDAFLAELAARSVLPVREGHTLRFELGGVHVHAVDGGLHAPDCLRSVIRREQPHGVLVSTEDWRQTLLSAALDEAPERVVYCAHTTTFLPAGPFCERPYPPGARLVARSRAVVAASRWLADYMALHFPDAPRARVIHPLFEAAAPPRYRSFDAGLVTMVNPCGVKGIDLFVDLARSLREVPFAAIPLWGTSDEDRAVLDAIPNVELLPRTERIDDFFSRTKIMLVPSLWQEVFGMIAIESLARGVPVLASDVGGLPEAMCGVDYVLPVRPIERYAVRDGVPVALDIPAQDASPWRHALERLLSDRAAYETLSDRSHDAATAWLASHGVGEYEHVLASLD